MQAVLADIGIVSRVLAFWDDVVVFSRYREDFVHKVFRSERGIGAPGKPVARRDKNVRGWHVTLARHFMYLADGLHLWWVLRRARRACQAIIMDRYIYDELANLPLTRSLSRIFIRLVLAVVPRPDVVFLLDVDPEAARARKPEYPVEFMRAYRRSYHDLADLAGMTVIPPLPLPQAKEEVEAVLRRALLSTTVRAA